MSAVVTDPIGFDLARALRKTAALYSLPVAAIGPACRAMYAALDDGAEPMDALQAGVGALARQAVAAK